MNRPNNVTAKMDVGGQGTKLDKFNVPTDEPKSGCDETSTGTCYLHIIQELIAHGDYF